MFLSNYLENPSDNPDASRIEVTSLKHMYIEFSWLFTCIISLEYIFFLPRNVTYALHYALLEKSIIDRGYLISNQFYFQLNNLKKT